MQLRLIADAFLQREIHHLMTSSVPPCMQVHKMLFRMRAEELTSAVTMGGYHVRLWKRARVELGLAASPDPNSRRSKVRVHCTDCI
jgi:hypothetical protein